MRYFRKKKNIFIHCLKFLFEIATWKYHCKVNLNCHVIFNKNYYSCPYQYVGLFADLKITELYVEIFINGSRVSTHPKFPEYIQYKYSTHQEDMPDALQRPEWDDERIISWATKIGSNCQEVVQRIFKTVKVKEQGYNLSLSLLRLSKQYSDQRLEAACKIALQKVGSPRYHQLKAIWELIATMEIYERILTGLASLLMTRFRCSLLEQTSELLRQKSIT